MSHITAKKAYMDLVDRINLYPQGAPPSETLYKILEMLFSEQEARLVAQLPIRPINVIDAAKIWQVTHHEAEKVLEGLAKRAVMLDFYKDGHAYYILPPPMAGFFEFSMMRRRTDLDQSMLAALYYEYLNVEEDFVKELFVSTKTPLVRTLVNESVLTSDQKTTILDFEKASHYIQTEHFMGVSTCYCRHKMEHMGKACDAPMDICMTFGTVAQSLIRSGHARRVDRFEGMDLLHQAYDHDLVQCGENYQQHIAFICNCCGCCCEALLAAKRFGNLHAVETTRFLAEINTEACNQCGVCQSVCPIDAISQEDNQYKVDGPRCLGCGICIKHCHQKAIHFNERATQIITPESSVHRAVLNAIDKGKLHELIMDNHALHNHRAMAAILSAILKLSPVKRAMATQQFRSVYLTKLLKRLGY